MKTKKIVIVGAGPIGCYCGQLLKKSGYKVTLLEEHKQIGLPAHCAGVVSHKLLKSISGFLSENIIENIVTSGEIFYENKSFILRQNKGIDIIDRIKFDKLLSKGLDIKFNTRFLGLEEICGKYIVETDKGEFHADIVIGADGAKSLVREFVTDEPVKCLKGVQFLLKAEGKNKQKVIVDLSDNKFFWSIPVKDNELKIGVISKNPFMDLKKIMGCRNIKGEVHSKIAGFVPYGAIRKISKDSIFLIGDSACQIKPFTFGGLFFGIKAAEILSDCIIKNKLEEYSLRWDELYGKKNQILWEIRKRYDSFSEEDKVKVFNILKKNVKIIEEYTDFDNHFSLIKKSVLLFKGKRDIINLLFKCLSF
ncbi:MAG: NAD(P)/FAD-dependent oxidoreductase [Candidatus Omnitrophica bacterium]|nr:NAD(P)/FAD-dependent oxidoreductase [Candidatus Omnitrophota bacterium]